MSLSLAARMRKVVGVVADCKTNTRHTNRQTYEMSRPHLLLLLFLCARAASPFADGGASATSVTAAPAPPLPVGRRGPHAAPVAASPDPAAGVGAASTCSGLFAPSECSGGDECFIGAARRASPPAAGAGARADVSAGLTRAGLLVGALSALAPHRSAPRQLLLPLLLAALGLGVGAQAPPASAADAGLQRLLAMSGGFAASDVYANTAAVASSCTISTSSVLAKKSRLS